MPLESLLKLAETLKERVDVHRDTLGASETLTRYALIDPLLRELGWDTSDPSAVIPEYSSGSGRADYALISAGKPAVMVEAKRLGTPLRGDVLWQVLNCCTIEGTAHFAVTDGARWDIYETFVPETRVDQRRIVEFDLLADSTASVCLNALALWRPSVEAGTVAPASDIWHRFSDTGYAPGRKPVELLFPDNARTALNGWFTLFVETVRWLSSNDHLTEAHCPIMLNGRIIVDIKPIHRDGITTKQVEANGFYVDRDNLVKHHFDRAMAVIEHVGQSPCRFLVRFA